MKINTYPNITTLADTDLLLVQTAGDGAYKNILVRDLKASFGSSGGGSSGGHISDPLFSNVTLLINITSAAIGDAKGATITNNGGILALADSTSPTGFAASFNGSGQYLGISDSNGIHLSSGDFTLEAFVSPQSTSGEKMVLSSDPAAFQQGYSLAISNGILRFESGGGNPAFNSSSGITANSWSHVAISRNGNNYFFAVNGVVTSVSNSGSWSDSNVLNIGANGRLDYPYYFAGKIAGIRITKGVARYVSNFTTPSTAFPTS